MVTLRGRGLKKLVSRYLWGGVKQDTAVWEEWIVLWLKHSYWWPCRWTPEAIGEVTLLWDKLLQAVSQMFDSYPDCGLFCFFYAAIKLFCFPFWKIKDCFAFTNVAGRWSQGSPILHIVNAGEFAYYRVVLYRGLQEAHINAASRTKASCMQKYIWQLCQWLHYHIKYLFFIYFPCVLL